jgi:UDP-glucose:(heptosyl)LPS alpha-1,3-glucosyltransferase
MRVALVIERFEADGGGVENVAWQVAEGLRAAGDEVHVVARRARGASGVQLHTVSVPDAWQPLRVLAFSRAAARAAPRGRFDVVHSFSRTRHQDVYRAGGGSHADYLESQHGAPGHRLRRLSPRHAMLLAMEKKVFADASQIVQCNSNMVRDALMRRYGIEEQRLVVIRNGVDLERFHPRRREQARRRLRGELGARDGPVWLLAGSGWRRKGLATALRALARAEPRDAELWVVGRDTPKPWRHLAARLGVNSRVRFLGVRRDLETLYAACDALLLPTRYDAFANVCLEAAAAGLPIVTSRSNGAAEILEEAGRVIENAEDAPAFAEALGALAQAELRERLGEAARHVAEAHGWSHHVEALRRLYRSLVA